MADRVERAAPKLGQIAAQQIGRPAHHFAGGLVGEGQQQQALRRHPLLQQISHAVNQGAGLAGAGPRQHQRRTGRGGDRLQLLRVEFPAIVNLQIDRRAERLQQVLTRHSRAPR